MADATRPADADDSIVSLPGSVPVAAARSGGRIVRAAGSAYTAAPGNWAAASGPVLPAGDNKRDRLRPERLADGALEEEGLTGDRATAEDVVQEAFLGLGRRWPGLDDPEKLAPYLRTSVINRCRSVHRARRVAWLRRPPDDPPVWSAEAAAIDGEDRREVLAAVASLPGRQREVLALRFYLDMSYSEIATALSISQGTVASTVSRALASLASQLDPPKENQ
jgi:RNA polymerase sigma factor (sigma-70 family)